ncbi:MAG: M14 family zinc carboxypeptidase, partial [Gemmatimonadota bacterium]
SRLRAVRDASPDLFSLEEIGRSVEGRAIYHVAFGRGPFRVLLWSQMHGDEPSATSALFDLFEYVRLHRADPAVARMLSALTIHVVPMLNPDGAERFQRRNAQGIDINRDALLLQAPEGRALKALRDRLSADVGFNLHNQSWRTSVGRPPRPASISLLAVAYDEARSENDGRRLTKRLCAVIRDALEPLAPGQLGRYDDEFEVRAFGDNVTLWGTPVVLIETGPWTFAEPDRPLVRLNFVALVTALDALATGRVRAADPARYESLPVNESRLFGMRISNATIVAGTGVAPFTGDVGVATTRSVRTENGRRDISLTGRIEDLGDLRVYAAIEEIDATGLTLVPDFLPAARPGDTVALPDWSSTPSRATIAVGQPAHFLLLRPARAPDTFVVERVIGVGERETTP